MRVTTAVALAATVTSASTLQVPRSAHIGRKVTVYASGRVARGITNGDAVILEIQPKANRGGNGFGVEPKFRAVVVGDRVRVVFRWPANDNHCFGAANCVKTPWRIGSGVDINVCAENPMFIVEACARGTVVVRD